jgi:hypothetical protein
MKVQITHRYDSSCVLYECEAPDGLSSGMALRHALEQATAARANLADANLAGANLAGANLADAYLAGANLAGANLAGAYLAGAKWRESVTISRAPLQLSGLHWMVYILDQHMQIGCELHSLDEWRGFDDARIVAMDGKDALRFWRQHKDALLSLAASDGRGVAAGLSMVPWPEAEAAMEQKS